MQLDKVKSLFLKVLIGCLIAAAGLAVVTVLLGEFTDVTGKALLTILFIAIHALISFSFIVNNERQETFDSLAFFTNATFTIIVLSFLTSVFGVWGIFPGELVGKLYMLYFVLLFAVLHGEILAKTTKKQVTIDKIVYVNYIFMAAVILMLLPIIFLNDSSEVLGDFYFRLLAAFGIIDATLTLVAVIMHKLYVDKHPKTNDAVFNITQPVGQIPGQVVPTVPVQQKRGMNIFVVILIAFVALQFIGGLIIAVIGALYF